MSAQRLAARAVRSHRSLLVEWPWTGSTLLFASGWLCAGILVATGRASFKNYGAYELLVTGERAVDEMDMANAALAMRDSGRRLDVRPRSRLAPAASAITIAIFSALLLIIAIIII